MLKTKCTSFLILVLSCFTGQLAQAIDDPWIYFNRAEYVLHGTVIQVVEGERDRLYQITSAEDLSFASNLNSWWLREPEGESTEAIGAVVGSRGAWLVANAVGGEFPLADATVLPGGLLSTLRPEDCMQLMRLKIESDRTNITLELMQSENPVVRQIAIGWWRDTEINPETNQQVIIESLFGNELDPRVQRSWLELYLQRGWTFEDTGLADLVPLAEDPTVSMLATDYIKERGTLRQKARLVSAWPSSDTEGKKRLLASYRQLALLEASPWILQGITSTDTGLKLACIEALGATGGIQLPETYTALLNSADIEIRTAALRGLAQNQTAGAWGLLNQTIDSLHSTDPLRQFATTLKKHPWKILKTRGRR